MPELLPPDTTRAATYWLRFYMRDGAPRDGACQWDPTMRTWSLGWGGSSRWSAEYMARSGVTIIDIPIPDPDGLEALRAVIAGLLAALRVEEDRGPVDDASCLRGHRITAGQVRAAAQALGL